MDSQSIQSQEQKIIDKDNKINRLLIKVLIFFIIFLSLLGGFIFNIKLLLQKRDDVISELNSLNRQNASILGEIRSIEEKSITAKKYIDLWENDFTPDQKVISGIKVAAAEKKIQDLASENHMVNVNVSYSPVILVGGVFERSTIKTYTTLFEIKFSSITDINIFNFLDDLRTKLGYFVIIQEVNFERTGKVDDEFLKTLKSGGSITAVKGTIKVRLYGIGLVENYD